MKSWKVKTIARSYLGAGWLTQVHGTLYEWNGKNWVIIAPPGIFYGNAREKAGFQTHHKEFLDHMHHQFMEEIKLND